MAQVRVRKRGKTFSYIFEAGKIEGKRKVVEKGGFPTKAEAYKAGVAAYTDFLHGNIGITRESITLKDFMTSWLKNVVALNVKPTTMQIYQTLFKVRIIPYLGEVKVQGLTPSMLDKCICHLAERGFSYSSLKVAYSIIHEALDYAVYPAQLISSNPAEYIKVPKNAPKNIGTGIRIGELLGLTWDDIDFEKKIISIGRQMIYISKRGQLFAPPKSKSGTRNIFIGDVLVDALKKWKELQKSNETAYGDTYVFVYCTHEDIVVFQSRGTGILNLQRVKFVCTQPDGRLLNKRSFMHLLKTKGVNAHSFRHTHATILAESGALPKAVAGRLGHSKIQTKP